MMAAALAADSNGKFKLTAQKMRDRFTTYKNRYLRAKAYENSTGAGMTTEDEKNNIYTMDQKLNSMCPWYEKMDRLFGEKANVEPLAFYDSTEVTEDDALTSADGVSFDAPSAPNSTGPSASSTDTQDDQDVSLFDETTSFLTPAPTRTSSTRSTVTRSRSLSFTLSVGSDNVSEAGFPLAQPTHSSTQLTPTPASRARRDTTSMGDVDLGRPRTTPSTSDPEDPEASRRSKKVRLNAPSSLNESPPRNTGSGARIATAMKLAADAKAKVERQRLDFDRERWSGEAKRQTEQQMIERDRLSFEKTKWEDEREDRRLELQQQQRFQVLNSLIGKGHSVDEARAYLELL